MSVCEQFKFRREISGDNPGPGWRRSTGNLERGDSCGPRGGAAAPVTALRGGGSREPALAASGGRVPEPCPAPRVPLPLGNSVGDLGCGPAHLGFGCGWTEEASLGAHWVGGL